MTPRSVVVALGLMLLVPIAAPPPLQAMVRVEMVDVSVEAGVAEDSHTSTANVHDFNGDGWKDVLIVRHRFAAARLYRNDQGTFTEVAAGTFFAEEGANKDRHDCAWGDVNRDGRPDLYCTLGGAHGLGVKANELWIQQRGGAWSDRAAEYGVTDPYGRGRHATFIDVNRDGYPDLYVGNGYPRQDEFVSRNRLFINVDGERFRSAPEYGLDEEVGGNSVQAVDFNEDGWKDLLVCGQDRLYLYKNRMGQSFRDVSGRTVGTGPCESSLMTNLDGQDRPDLVNVAAGSVTVDTQQARGSFTQAFAKELGYGAGVAAGDVNGDSSRDLYVMQRGPEDRDRPDLLLVNGGTGTSFREAAIPQTSEGVASDVASIDHDRNGLTDFFVLNGHNEATGPIRLLAAR